MNRTIKEATVRCYHYDRSTTARSTPADFMIAYNYARRLKTLKGLNALRIHLQWWTSQPERFKLNPLHHTLGLNT